MLRIKNYTDEQLDGLQKKQDLDLSQPVEFYIIDALQVVSKNNNDMFELKIKLYQDGVEHHLLKDWIVFNTNKWLPEQKVKDFYKACGLIQQYESGQVDASFLVRSKAKGQCMLRERKYVKDGEEKMGIEVCRYIHAEEPAKEVSTKIDNDFNDDIPF